MIVLFDTDVLIDVATERKPFSTHSSAVLDAAEAHLFVSFIAWHSLSNFYYIVSSTKGNTNAKEFLKDLLKFVQIAPGSTSDAIQATMLHF
jgi:predicted nucleic acid-binding protein